MADRDEIYREILDFISRMDNFLVSTHLSADGDAYGSALAIAYLLEKTGKRYQLIIHDQEKDDKYAFLWGWDKIKSFDSAPQRFEAAILLDVPSRSRIGDPASLLPAREYCVKIDHHPDEDDFAAYNLINVKASSTCSLVYEIAVRSAAPMDRAWAELLLSGIMYDTGRFSFSNTNQRDFEIAADLVSYGLFPHLIANQLFFSNNFESLRVIGYGLANIESHLDGKVCVIYLPEEIMREARNLDVEELSNYSLAVKGVEVGLFVRQMETNFVKVSFRSKGKVDVNSVARKFGGGGHIHAAGCRYNGDPESLKTQIIAEIQKQLEG